jgi:hypothetical protein
VDGAVLGVAVGAQAGVVAADGVLLEAFPHLGLEVVAEELGHTLLHPPHQNGCRLRSLGVHRLIGGEHRQPGGAQFAFQLQRVVHVAAGPFDVLADHGGERWLAAGDGGAELGHAAVAGDAGGGELLPHIGPRP